MSKGRSKEHHFVPKVLQKQFCWRTDHIWYSTKSKNGRFEVVEDRNIDSTFKIRDYYTILEENAVLSDKIERQFYGIIDDYLGKFLPEVLGGLERGFVPLIRGNALIGLRRTVLEMIKRTPDFNPNHDDTELGKKLLEGLAKVIAEKSDFLDQSTLVCELDNPVKLKHIGRDKRVRSTIRRSEKVDGSLNDLEPRWAYIDGKHSFILSSLIAYRIGNGGATGIAQPNMEVWMPISPKVALVLLRDPEKISPPIVCVDRQKVRAFNQYAVKYSSAVASHSEELLKSLIK